MSESASRSFVHPLYICVCVLRLAISSISIHCGELPMAESSDAEDPALLKAYQEALSIIQFKPDRLGHALLLCHPLMEKLQQNPIPIECCPTSNIMTLKLALHHKGNLMDGMKRHPQLEKWLENAYPININTDDSGLFCTNLTKELLLVAKAFCLDEEQIGDAVLSSVEHIFDNRRGVKSRLKEDICAVINSYVATWNHVDGK